MAFLIRVVYMICHKRQQQENMAISFPGLREALGLKTLPQPSLLDSRQPSSGGNVQIQ